MKKLIPVRFASLFIFSFCGIIYGQQPVMPIIPIPTQYEMQDGEFVFDENTLIYADFEQQEVLKIVQDFQSKFRTVSGMLLPLLDLADLQSASNNVVVFRLDSSKDLGGEGYEFEASENKIILNAVNHAGLFYAVQSLKQLLPPEVEKEEIVRAIDWKVPAVTITDTPKYKWRGLHLDTGRHISSVSFIKKYLDNMAAHKLNTFHWHLTEDQGWRLEIKKYPKLTEIGAFRDSTLAGHYSIEKYDGKRYGGFYTQDEAREIVQYAKDLYITVIPEIEMPGHSTAAVAAYPKLGVTGKKVRPSTTWGVFPDILNVEEHTFNFMEDVLTEVMGIFPSEFIHIGGDEAPKKQWEESERIQFKIDSLGLKDEHELQSYFITRIEKFLNAKGRQIIGWDEILEGGLAPNAAVMSWRGEEGGIAAAKSGHHVVMSPGSHMYLDHGQGDPDAEPLNIGGYLPLEKVYSYSPTPAELSDKEAQYIMGAQANVWTEYLPTEDSREYMVFPRISALSEVVWSGEEHKDWESFKARMPRQLKRYSYKGINYSTSIYNAEINEKYDALSENYTVELVKQWDGELRYTTDGSEPISSSNVYKNPMKMKPGLTIKAGLFKDGKLQGEIVTQELKEPKQKVKK